MNSYLKIIDQKKRQLGKLKPISEKVMKELEAWIRVELTYSSNAIEGNTLSRIETAEVLEKGTKAVISGKPLKDQIEAVNHAKAIDFINDLSKEKKGHQFVSEDDIKKIHQIILSGIDDRWAGKYRQSTVLIKGVDVEFPEYHKVPYHMAEFVDWLQLQQETHPVRVAADAHFKLVSIHPFIDGNGRAARLLMNLVLIANSFPMAVIRNEERTQYLEAVNKGQTKGNLDSFYKIIFKAIERSLDAYINAAKGKSPLKPLTKGANQKETRIKFLKIGELAKETGETVPTIRYWTKQGLLSVNKYSPGGYQLYSPGDISRVKEIRKLQKEKRLTIEEIKSVLS